MKRKLLSLILVAALLASMLIFVPTASAAENVATIKTTDAVGFAGDEVTVDVTISVDSFAGFQLAFTYDSSRLTYNGVSYDQTGSNFAPSGAAENKQFVNNGPYTLIGRAWQDAAGKTFLFTDCVDTKFATLSFTIKEDAPIGDAYVEFCPLDGVWNDVPYSYDLITRSAQLGDCDDIMYEGSKVTVLPKGYSSESTFFELSYENSTDKYNPNAANGVWSFTWASDYSYVTLTGYTGTHDGVLVIPAYVDDGYSGPTPVTGIASMAFNANTTLTAVVIPETVTSIALGAFCDCAIADYYVLNSECEIASGAMGASGQVYRGTWREGPYVNVLDAETLAVPTIHAAEGSTAAAYAALTYAANPTYPSVTTFNFEASAKAPTESKVTFDGNSYYVLTGATVKAPGTAVTADGIVVGWTDGTNTYAAGEAIAVTGDIALEPVTITAPQTATDVDFKFAEQEADLAMRFTSLMSIEDYEALAKLGTVQLGMLITPAKRVAQAGSFTKEALDALEVTHKYVDIEIDGYYKKTATDYIFAGSLKGFSASTLAKNPDFAAVLYATVTTDAGDVFTVYGDFNFAANQDVKTVAEGLSTSSDLTDTQKGWLTTLVSKFGV